jgi:YidC/Oxa1 family membrane protein insertase
MAESVNGGGQPPKEMSMEMRLLLAFLLMGAVMWVTPYFFKSQNPTPIQKTAQSGGPSGAVAPSGSPAGAVAPSGQSGPSGPARASTAEAATTRTEPDADATPEKVLPNVTIDTDVYRVTLSNQGGTVRSWLLKKFNGNDGKPLDLVNTSAGLDFPFSLYMPDREPVAKKVNWAWYSQAIDPDNLGVTYLYSDGHTTVRKVFQFRKSSYLSKVSTEVTNDGNPVPHMLQWRGGFGDLTIANPSGTEHTLHFDLSANKLVSHTAGDAKKGPVPSSGTFSFAGIADTYFAAVFLPEGNDAVQQVTFADTVRTPLEEKPLPFAGLALSDGPSNRFELFVGPKDVDLLKSVNPKLEQVVDFGWMSILAKPLFLIVNWFNDQWVHNYGWSIVVVTIALNMILFPVKLSNFKSMRKMQALKPQIDAINARYKNLKITDPKKGEQNQEVMDLYKKYGVNPMGGCFPMLIQIPFFFAFYKVFTVSVEMRGAPWLWVTDLSQPEHLPIKILPLVMIGSQFLMQKITPQANADPSQQKMMMFMPLIFGFMFYNFASGLVLYYLTSNLVQMGQQWFFNHTQAAVEAAESVAPPKKKNGRK